MKTLITLLLTIFMASAASAYLGSFDPTPFRSRAIVTFTDTPIPNIECAKRLPLWQAPIAMAAVLGCVNGTYSEVVASITPSPFWAVLISHGHTPYGVVGHELRHIFDGAFHGILPFIDVMRINDEERRAFLHQEHGREVRVERRGGQNEIRVYPATKEADCVIFIRDKDVSYHDLGVLAAECAKR